MRLPLGLYADIPVSNMVWMCPFVSSAWRSCGLSLPKTLSGFPSRPSLLPFLFQPPLSLTPISPSSFLLFSTAQDFVLATLDSDSGREQMAMRFPFLLS